MKRPPVDRFKVKQKEYDDHVIMTKVYFGQQCHIIQKISTFRVPESQQTGTISCVIIVDKTKVIGFYTVLYTTAYETMEG